VWVVSNIVENETSKGGTGVRWYMLSVHDKGAQATPRFPFDKPVVLNQGTYAPDHKWRFLSSAATDRQGNIALGFTVSAGWRKPGVAITGRLFSDPAATLQAENIVHTGKGMQKFGLNRWGDWSSMAVDPVDDCQFWYTNQYMSHRGVFNWRTRIVSFHFPNCGPTQITAPSDQNEGSGAEASSAAGPASQAK